MGEMPLVGNADFTVGHTVVKEKEIKREIHTDI
jgi:hypothetical protein